MTLKRLTQMPAQSPSILCSWHAQPSSLNSDYICNLKFFTHPTCLAKDFPSWDMSQLVDRIVSIRNTALTVVENKLCQEFTCHEYQPCLVIYNTKSGQWNTDLWAASLVAMLHFYSYHRLIKHTKKYNLELKFSKGRERRRILKCTEYLLKASPCAGTLLMLPL